ncbi:hypothetical protein Dsui_0769 [Azospira oryzae PS]|uniref:Uncharacterized protein n=1 Tax=Azospira oryzae (strain ATCC BAA-33 / DSM 13638 / PS) TaxID=640081 RepID=G8QHM6_AZOOP|nr:hypothetical protein [Azospira oryzae]AEV25177.1 hypothetical protein Dsui_0769 [Azospira oryzae PS]
MNNKERKCQHCKAELINKRQSAKFCTDNCRTQYNNAIKKKNREATAAKRQAARSNKFDQSTFASYLIGECKRAGTTQVLEGIGLEGLKQLRDLVAKRTTYNGGEYRQYAISHIFPAFNPRSGSIGILCPENLVIASTEFNQKRGNKLPKEGAGKCIPIKSLKRKFNVGKRATKSEVLAKIKAAIGATVYNAFLKEYASKLGLTSRNKIKAKLAKHNIHYSKSATLEELQEAHSQAFGNDFKIGYSREATPIQYVLMEETNRLAPWSPFKLFVDFYTSDAYWSYHFRLVQQENIKEIQSYIFEQAFKHLHGDEYSLEYQGRSLISYFRLKSSINLLDEHSPFVLWLHSEGCYLSEEEQKQADLSPF